MRSGNTGRMRFVAALGFCVVACAVAPGTAIAIAEGPQWTVTAISQPTNFAANDTSGEEAYRVELTNTGGSASNGEPVTITDELPAGVELAPAGASAIDELAAATSSGPAGAKFTCSHSSCTFIGAVAPEDTLIVTFPVEVLLSAPATVTNVVRVNGGGAPDASRSTQTQVSETAASFGISPGSAATALSSTQAGAHPDITTSIALNTVNRKGALAGDPKDVTVEEPSGFAGDLVDTPACAAATFSRAECPIDTQIGITTVTLLELDDTAPHVYSLPVYNLAPNPGEVAKFGFEIVGNFAVQGNVSVRPGDYGLRVAFHETDEAPAELDAVSLTVWGVPASHVHDTWRWEKAQGAVGGRFGASSEVAPAPYFTNPTSCSGESLAASFHMTSWEGDEAQETMRFAPIVGCDRLAMPTSFTAVPTTETAEAPTGLDVNLRVQQTYEDADGLASSTLNRAVVTLPEGMTVNPSEGAGLGACTIAEYEEEALEEATARGCPENSKLGTVSIVTPALKEEGEGSVFLAQPYANPLPEDGHPSGSLLALYVVARFHDRGVLVKVAGRVAPNPVTGQLVTTFEGQPALGGLPGLAGLPPVPFSSFSFEFSQGQTAPLATPPTCGSYYAKAELNPWSEPEEVLTPELRPFRIAKSCPAGAPPFAPRVIAGTENNLAGVYSPMYIRVIRHDGEREITRFSSKLPPGLSANLSNVPFCPDAAIELARGKTGAQEEAQSSCPATSEIGHTLVGAGVGQEVLAQAAGKVYMAGPYNGAPFSIAAITSAKVGPFDLGTVVVREALRIDPKTADVTVDASASDPIPHIIRGIVVHVRDIRVYIDRPSFVLNPTSCERLTFASTVSGAGADPSNPVSDIPATVDDPFQAADCRNLNFKPAFKVSTTAKHSRAGGVSLTATLTYPKWQPGTVANIRSVKVSLPKQLPSRLTTLQKACLAGVFDANPSNCPAESRVGSATAITPILPVPLAGPAYFVSNGSAKFPELMIVLQGYGITIDLRGETFINEKTGITSSTFRSVPDQPVSRFTLTLPQGPDSALAAIGNLCKSKLKMPTAFTAQNGMKILRSTPITVAGCHKATKAKSARHRRGGARK